MSDQDKTQLNNRDDLADFKSLIGDTAASSDSVDDILSEYGKPNRTSIPVRNKVARAAPVNKGKVVPFPGKQAAASVPEPKPEKPDPKPDPQKEPAPEPSAPPAPEPEEEEIDHIEEPEQHAKVIQFPEEESILSAFIKDLSRKAADYADHMYEEDERTDHEQVRRLEKLIPGTDLEEEQPPPSRLHRPKKVIPPPPDTPPAQLAKEYGRGLKGMRVRVILIFLLMALSLAQMLVPMFGLVWPAPLDQRSIQLWACVVLTGLGSLLCFDVLGTGLLNIVHGKIGMDTLTVFSCIFTLTDSIFLALSPETSSRMPYSSVVLVGLFFLLHGCYHKRCALRLSCRTASTSSTPYRVTLDPGKWNGRDTYVKWSGTPERFGSQIQADDGCQRIFYRICPLLLLGVAVFTVLIGQKEASTDQLLWGLSAMFTAVSAFGSSIAYGRPFHKVSRRLAPSGAALAGWPGLPNSKKADRVLITDTDLFPPGYVSLNGVKILGNLPMEKVLSYTTTLIRESGSGLTKPFHDYLRTVGGLMRRCEQFACYEGGGLSATVRHDQVLVGSASFMNLMEVSLPQGLPVKNAVFCAINGELAGIFALNYSLPDTVIPALDTLIHEKIGPVLATRDFNLIPSVLHQRFKLNTDRMDFPPVERRRELSEATQSHNETVTALLSREGLYPFSESITAAKRLRWAAIAGAILCSISSVLGLLLSAYLVSVAAYGSLAPLNLLTYLLTWFLPVWLLSDWVHRF